MFENIEKLKLLSIYEGISAANVSFIDKPSHFLVCKINGESLYSFGNEKTIHTKPGDVLYIPKGADYNVRKLSVGESRYIAVRFEADGMDNSEELYKLQKPETVDVTADFINMNSLWIFGSAGKRMKCYSVLYSLLSTFAYDGHEYAGHSAKSILSECMTYLGEHIFDIGLSVDELISRSGVSGTYFRRCFAAVYGISPKSYIVDTRLARARSMLDSGDFGSIADIARSVGFDDPLYFGKAFKKKYGVPPSEYLI